MDREAWQATVHGVTKMDMTEQLTHTKRVLVPGNQLLEHFPKPKPESLKQGSVVYQKKAVKSDKSKYNPIYNLKFALYLWASYLAYLNVISIIHVYWGY